MNLDPRPPVPPQRLAWTALAACLAATFGGIVIIRISPAGGLWFNEVFCILAVAWTVTRWSGRAPAAYVGLRWPGLPAVLFAAALSVANYIGLAGPINAVSEHFAPDSLKDALDITHLLEQLSASELWLFGSAAVLAAPFCEEFLFRGVLQQGLARGSRRSLEAVFLSGLIFALFHMNPVSFLALFELGIFFGLLYQRTGSLVPGIVAHATQNATTLAIYYAFQFGRPETSETEMPASKIIGLAGMGIVVILALLFLVARRFPAVWGRPAAVNSERPRISLARALAPWLVGASVGLLGWYAIDRRSLELGVADLRVDVPAPRADEPSDAGAARGELEVLRKQVRAGQAPLHEYLERRRALAESLQKQPPVQAPAKRP